MNLLSGARHLIMPHICQHMQVKAFFEWLMVSRARVATIGVRGPLEGTDFAMEIDIEVRTAGACMLASACPELDWKTGRQSTRCVGTH